MGEAAAGRLVWVVREARDEPTAMYGRSGELKEPETARGGEGAESATP